MVEIYFSLGIPPPPPTADYLSTKAKSPGALSIPKMGGDRSACPSLTPSPAPQPWHPDCFTCGTCGLPIKEAEFKVEGPKAFHRNCRIGVGCAGCLRWKGPRGITAGVFVRV